MTKAQTILKRPYSRAIVPDDAGAYFAQIVEFPGCFAEGRSPEEAYENLESAAESWIDATMAQGLTVPEPYATQAYSGTVSLRLAKSLHRDAADAARREGVSLNAFLVMAIARRVGAAERAEPVPQALHAEGRATPPRQRRRASA